MPAPDTNNTGTNNNVPRPEPEPEPAPTTPAPMTLLLEPVRSSSSSSGSGNPRQQTSPPTTNSWLQSFIAQVDDRRRTSSLPPVDPTVQDLRQLVDGRPHLRMWASAMFDEIPNKAPYNNGGGSSSSSSSQFRGQRSLVRGFHHMVELFGVIVAEVAPSWSTPASGEDDALANNLLGVPFQAILDWPMGTPSGHAFLLQAEVNERLRAVLDAWRDQVLKTRKSLRGVTRKPDGWLCEEALEAIEAEAEAADVGPGQHRHRLQHRLRFQDLFECDPEGDAAHWGFASWDDFFTRQFRDMDRVRPVAYPDRPEWVANVCEAVPVAIQPDIREYDSFWLKGQAYSVAEMLHHHPLAGDFIGGTAYQAVLRPTTYHRWTSPVSGHVVDAAA
ncbi:hypothetical protein E4U41_003873, partial [Claviceps citrina]